MRPITEVCGRTYSFDVAMREAIQVFVDILESEGTLDDLFGV